MEKEQRNDGKKSGHWKIKRSPNNLQVLLITVTEQEKESKYRHQLQIKYSSHFENQKFKQCIFYIRETLITNMNVSIFSHITRRVCISVQVGNFPPQEPTQKGAKHIS